MEETVFDPSTLVLPVVLLLGLVVVKLLLRRSSAGPQDGTTSAPELNAPDRQERPASEDVKAQVARLIAANRKIEAIKVFREATGVGLKEAKDAIESGSFASGGGRAAGPDADAVDLDEVRQLVERGNKLEAIKAYREATGVGLAEAKHAVEQLERDGRGW